MTLPDRLMDAFNRTLVEAKRLPGRLSAKEMREQLLDFVFEIARKIDDDDADAVVHRVQLALASEQAPPVSPPRARGQQPSSRREPQKPRGTPSPDLIAAPYRFVDFEPKIVLAESAAKKAGFASPVPGGFCGTIDLTLAVETPMLIGEEKGPKDHEVAEPMQLGEGNFVIPGATLRGLLRSTVEIVAASRLAQANRHHRYGVRDFTHPLFSDDHRPGWDRLGSAWLRRIKAGDTVTHELDLCDKRLIRIRSLPRRLNGGKPTASGAFHLSWLQKELGDKYTAADYRKGGQHREPETFDFSAANAKSFTQDQAFGEHFVSEASGGRFKGLYVFSGHSPTLRDVSPTDLDQQDTDAKKGNQKKVEYVFGSASNGTLPLPLPQEVWENFELINSKPSKNSRKADGSWKILEKTLEGGGRIPVFFIRNDNGNGDITDIGLTRLFKRGHSRTMQNVLEAAGHAAKIDEAGLDLTETLFGTIREKDEWLAQPGDPVSHAAKSRVAFGFARLSPQTPGKVDDQSVSTVMMAPRGSYAPFYLAGRFKDWSDDAAKPAGRKRYFPRFAKGDLEKSDEKIRQRLAAWQGNDKAETKSALKFLSAKTTGGELVFEAQIRLHNVTAAEIGALLFALTHGGDPEKPFRHMIGRAKNAGAGQTRVEALELRLRGNDAEADAGLQAPQDWEKRGADAKGWVGGTSSSMVPFLQAFARHMRKTLPKWPNTPAMREFLGASRPGHIAAPPGVNYDPTTYLQRRQFQPLRAYCKLDTSKAAPPEDPKTQRYLAALPVEVPLLAWLEV